MLDSSREDNIILYSKLSSGDFFIKKISALVNEYFSFFGDKQNELILRLNISLKNDSPSNDRLNDEPFKINTPRDVLSNNNLSGNATTINNLPGNNVSIDTSISLENFTSKIKFEDMYLKAEKDLILIRIPIADQKIKIYYSDYKNYYYLTNEDYAIHESVASFVDKKYRVRANKKNCYSYININNNFLENENQLKNYASAIIKFLFFIQLC